MPVSYVLQMMHMSQGIKMKLIAALIMTIMIASCDSMKQYSPTPSIYCENINIGDYPAKRCLVPHGWFVYTRSQYSSITYYADENHTWKL